MSDSNRSLKKDNFSCYLELEACLGTYEHTDISYLWRLQQSRCLNKAVLVKLIKTTWSSPQPLGLISTQRPNGLLYRWLLRTPVLSELPQPRATSKPGTLSQKDHKAVIGERLAWHLGTVTRQCLEKATPAHVSQALVTLGLSGLQFNSSQLSVRLPFISCCFSI